MGTETNSATGCSTSGSSPTTSSPSGKRTRDPEDELYIDNLHSHKRYLSEIMASSLNGLTVGDPMPDSLLESPARSEPMSLYSRDEMPWQYSPMSEDSDDSRLCDAPINTTAASSSSSQPQSDSAPSSPVSPHRHQKPLGGPYSAPPSYATIASSQTRQQRSSDSEGRFPSSPSDICHTADLRRAALLRSVQMRTHHPLGSSFSSGQEQEQELERERPCSCIKSLVDVDDDNDDDDDDDDDEEREVEYQIECSPMGISDPECNNPDDKSC